MAPFRSMLVPPLLTVLASASAAQSNETSNGCAGTNDDPCVRVGTCSLQGSTWHQTAILARADIFDTMGWPGLCDQIHVALVQENCEVQSSGEIFIPLTEASFAILTDLEGSLSCPNVAPEEPAVPALDPRWLALLLAVLGCAGAWRSR